MEKLTQYEIGTALHDLGVYPWVMYEEPKAWVDIKNGWYPFTVWMYIFPPEDFQRVIQEIKANIAAEVQQDKTIYYRRWWDVAEHTDKLGVKTGLYKITARYVAIPNEELNDKPN